MTCFVVDCSITMAWHFEDEKNSYADKVLGIAGDLGSVGARGLDARGFERLARRGKAWPNDQRQISKICCPNSVAAYPGRGPLPGPSV